MVLSKDRIVDLFLGMNLWIRKNTKSILREQKVI